jgi:hypothetical protein
MRTGSAKQLGCALAIGVLLCCACSRVTPTRAPAPSVSTDHLSLNEQIAGEIMAYLIEVVLGRAGAPEKRQEWSTRGLEVPLDFDLVNRRMFGPVPLRAELMVLDTNILGLSRVLYHYDRRLNLFKGRRDHDSLYPCSELMAIRLLLLQKLHRSEKVSLAALSRHAALFAPGSRDAVGAELAAMQLSAVEFRFLKDIFQSEPAFLRYMRHPFIVSTLRKMGVVEADAFTQSADLAATYDQLSCSQGGKPSIQPITIAIVPSMNPMFETTAAGDGLRPTTAYSDLQATITDSIVHRLDTRKGAPLIDKPISFFTPDRPVTIHPENADQVIDQICPTVDFSIIVMGKNVYRAVFIDPDADIYPHTNRIYLDVDDIRYRQIDHEVDLVVSALRSLFNRSY